MPSRQQLGRVTVSLDGVNLGVWDDKTGGDTDSNGVQYFLGGGGPRISLGGAQQVSNLVLMKLQDLDILARRKWIASRVGKPNNVVVTEYDLDDEYQTIGEPMSWKGTLKRAKPSDRNAQSNSAAQYEIEVEVSGPMA